MTYDKEGNIIKDPLSPHVYGEEILSPEFERVIYFPSPHIDKSYHGVLLDPFTFPTEFGQVLDQDDKRLYRIKLDNDGIVEANTSQFIKESKIFEEELEELKEFTLPEWKKSTLTNVISKTAAKRRKRVGNKAYEIADFDIEKGILSCLVTPTFKFDVKSARPDGTLIADNSYVAQIRFDDWKKLVGSDLSKFNLQDLKALIQLSDVAFHCECPAWHWTGLKYEMSLIKSAIYPTTIADDYWKPKHGSDKLPGLCKHLAEITRNLQSNTKEVLVQIKKRSTSALYKERPPETTVKNPNEPKIIPGAEETKPNIVPTKKKFKEPPANITKEKFMSAFDRRLIETWVGALQDNYRDEEEWESYSETYGLLDHLNKHREAEGLKPFENNQEAWITNPRIEGSTEAGDFNMEENFEDDGYYEGYFSAEDIQNTIISSIKHIEKLEPDSLPDFIQGVLADNYNDKDFSDYKIVNEEKELIDRDSGQQGGRTDPSWEPYEVFRIKETIDFHILPFLIKTEYTLVKTYNSNEMRRNRNYDEYEPTTHDSIDDVNIIFETKNKEVKESVEKLKEDYWGPFTPEELFSKAGEQSYWRIRDIVGDKFEDNKYCADTNKNNEIQIFKSKGKGKSGKAIGCMKPGDAGYIGMLSAMTARDPAVAGERAGSYEWSKKEESYIPESSIRFRMKTSKELPWISGKVVESNENNVKIETDKGIGTYKLSDYEIEMNEGLSIPQKNQKKIAISTLKMNDVGANIMGGMTKEEARKFLKSIGYSEKQIDKLEEAFHENELIIEGIEINGHELSQQTVARIDNSIGFLSFSSIENLGEEIFKILENKYEEISEKEDFMAYDEEINSIIVDTNHGTHVYEYKDGEYKIIGYFEEGDEVLGNSEHFISQEGKE